MIASRESVLGALFTKLKNAQFSSPVNGSNTWRTTSRRVKLWGDVPPASRPALFMTDHHETYQYKAQNEPVLTTINVDVFVYIDARDPGATPSSMLNIIMDAITSAIGPTPGFEQKQTLGGLVSHCRIEGEVLKDPGDLDGDGMLIIPIKIMST